VDTIIGKLLQPIKDALFLFRSKQQFQQQEAAIEQAFFNAMLTKLKRLGDKDSFIPIKFYHHH
jgi:hypothetical protein